jgi:DNA polymerase-3 subunit delta'
MYALSPHPRRDTAVPCIIWAMTSNWDIVGHEWAVQYLRRSLLNERGAHAYLLSGPPQIGKGLLALRLAQRLVCETDNLDPCLACRACKRVVHDNHPDVRAISLATQQANDKPDAAKSREMKIDTVREWQRDIGLRPFEARRRVFILDDAQALTEAASNALLKTLEEPPAYAVLILIAQGSGDLLPTIVSRCRVLRLRPLPRAVVARALQVRNVAAEDAELIAAWSGGRIGWALQAVDTPDFLEAQQQRLDVLLQLGRTGRVERMQWAEERAKEYRGDAAAVLAWVRLWQSWWRDVLLVQSGNARSITHRDRRAELEVVAEALSLDRVQQFLVRLDIVCVQLADNVNPQLALEHVMLHLP